MRQRDGGEEGEHYARSRTYNTKRKVVVPEYRSLSYPITLSDKVVNWFVMSASYNRYYLVQLEDGSYICAFFDDYLMLSKGAELPVGRVRYSTAEERNMLSMMAEDYKVDQIYVLDMYREGKAPWLLDKPLRLIAAIAAAVQGMSIVERVKKKRKDGE